MVLICFTVCEILYLPKVTSQIKGLKGQKLNQKLLCLLLAQLPGRLFSPRDICKKLSHHFLLHFPIGMGSYDHHAKYQGVFP